MKPIDAILVPLDGSATAAGILGLVQWLAGRLNAAVHLLAAGNPELPVEDELRRLQVPAVYWPDVILHRSERPPEQCVLELVEACGVGLLAMSSHGEAADARGRKENPLGELGHVTRWVAEHSPVPVLVVPPGYQERLPWTTALVPVSGEAEADEVLGFAACLGSALGLTATAVHVLRPEDGGHGLAAEARYADAPHHEYPGRLQQIVERGLPGCTASEAECIEDVVLCRGDVAKELLDLVERRSADLVIVGWHGTFVAGHAGVLRALLRQAACPLLLVKPPPPAPFKLKVGEEIE